MVLKKKNVPYVIESFLIAISLLWICAIGRMSNMYYSMSRFILYPQVFSILGITHLCREQLLPFSNKVSGRLFVIAFLLVLFLSFIIFKSGEIWLELLQRFTKGAWVA